MGMSGLFMMAFVMDVIINPISPDLLVFGKSGLQSIHPTWLIALVGGSASVCAGIVGYGIGTLIQTNQLMGMIGAKHYQSTHRLFKTKGHWAVLIGALSPIPFSAVCWSAGFFQMTFRVFFITVLCTRLPRFLAMAYLGSFFI
jgi:membrane protein YqaA with SNARE-associated domain